MPVSEFFEFQTANNRQWSEALLTGKIDLRILAFGINIAHGEPGG